MKNLNEMGLTLLPYEAALQIDGGHDGVAYQMGRAAGEVVKFASTVLGVIAIILVPKS